VDEVMMSGMTKYVYGFSQGSADGEGKMKGLLGGKGAQLAEMAALGIAVPAGFTLTTEVCRHYMHAREEYPGGLVEQVDAALEAVEEAMGRRFGDRTHPLLLSVRSGAPISMPGMMDTVLNLGLNDETVEALAKATNNRRFAMDSYRRFIQMFSEVVMGLEGDVLEDILDRYKRERGYGSDVDIDAAGWETIIAAFKQAIKEELGREVPTDPREQLWAAIGAVFSSWNTRRAQNYRRYHGIDDELGTAVNVMAMVFGNLGDQSASGVAFTRNPATGERHAYGEYLINAQGEDVVAGIRTPAPLNKAEEIGDGPQSMERVMPELHQELLQIFDRLEQHYREMQDIEFTVEEGKLWILQTRTGKRTGPAAVRIALEMIDEGLIDEKEAILRVDPRHHIGELLHPALAPEADRSSPLARGLAASPGAAVGKVVMTADEAEKMAKEGIDVILVRRATSAEDVHGLQSAVGVLTQTGGMTSHAAVVARSIGTPCISGAADIHIAPDLSGFHVGDRFIKAGDVLTLDATEGLVFEGALNLVEAQWTEEVERFMKLADKHRRLEVRANADTPEDARRAREFGATGIGLCRTEHMFFSSEARLEAMRMVILAEDDVERARGLEELLKAQREDFTGILETMDGLPVTVRLLDPPLHEFLPEDEQAIAELADHLGKPVHRLRGQISSMRESNPMLGFRGCRVGILFPEIYLMQVRALVEAALTVTERGCKPKVEIMIPLVADVAELSSLRKMVEETLEALFGEHGQSLHVHIGTMIELPRAALTAGAIAAYADFFSFGTNDLTQATYGLSRDDAGRFLPMYLEKGLLKYDPFVTLDQNGVGELVEMGTSRGKQARPELVVGICGEHGGDPASVAFCHKIGMDYVSCSPFRVPIARLAAAHAALKSG
jgi:pyruvate, orthophosphate dikinase